MANKSPDDRRSWRFIPRGCIWLAVLMLIALLGVGGCYAYVSWLAQGIDRATQSHRHR
jgi:hypothetical protein